MKIAFWGSSLVSAYWNGAATYYRGILRALANSGNSITFFEPDAYDRHKHRDIPDPDWARIVIYDASDSGQVEAHLQWSEQCDVVVKASGVGVLDNFLEHRVSAMPETVCKVFWDVDAPATLERIATDPADVFHTSLPGYDLVLTYGGGERVTSEYISRGARECCAIYNAFDPDVHHPVVGDPRFRADLSFLGNRLPDREARVEEFFLRAAESAPEKSFVLGGSGWGDKGVPPNIRYVGHVYTKDHNAFNCSAEMVLNISRDSMARYGFSPATRVFEAAGSAACIITDRWQGISTFLEPEREILVADNGSDVAALLRLISAERAQSIGQAARRRVLADHTYEQRGKLVEDVLESVRSRSLRGLEIQA